MRTEGIGRRGTCAFAWTLALAALLAATSGANAAEKVVYLLPAPAFLPAFGPWMVAKQRGYFAKEGLDVDFEAAQGGADAAKQVGAGNAVIGGADRRHADHRARQRRAGEGGGAAWAAAG